MPLRDNLTLAPHRGSTQPARLKDNDVERLQRNRRVQPIKRSLNRRHIRAVDESAHR
jgi:hypothetical protein